MDERNELNQQWLAARNRLLCCVGCVVALGFAGSMAIHSPFLLGIVLIAIPVPWYLVSSWMKEKVRRRYRSTMKRSVVLRPLQSTVTDLDYRPEFGISKETVAGTKMVRIGSGFRSEGCVTGRYHGIPFVQSEVLILSGRRGSKIAFEGQWMIFDFRKRFRTELHIVQGGIRCTRNSSPCKRVSSRSKAFDSTFEVYANSDRDACSILTPEMTERMQGLAAQIQGRLMFCFSGSRLHVAIHNYSASFKYSEPGNLFEPLDARAASPRTRDEISLILWFVDELNGNSELFQPEE